MEINKLRYFNLVYELKSIRKAADFLKMSPGSLSKSIKNLEIELDINLFTPDGRNIIPTNEAHKIYQQSLNLVLKTEDFINNIKNKTSPKKSIRISSWAVFNSYLIPSFINENSQYEYEILTKVPGQLEKSILQDQTNIGITYAPITMQGLEYLKIASFKFNTYGVKKFQKIPFKKWPFAIPISKPKGSIVQIEGLDNWPSEIERNIPFKLQSLESALILATQGTAVVHCPEFIIKKRNQFLKEKFKLHQLHFSSQYKPKKLDIFIVIKKGQIENQIIKKLAKEIRINCN